MEPIEGKVAGLPSCADPRTTGLEFAIKNANGVRHFRVAGSAHPEQSPNSALGMSAILLAALTLGSRVEVETPDQIPGDRPSVATGVIIYAVPKPGPAEIANPYSSTVFSVGVLDRPPRTLLQTNLNYKATGNDSVYFDTSDASHVVHWATTLAFAAATGGKVTLDWTPVPDAERRMTNVRLGG